MAMYLKIFELRPKNIFQGLAIEGNQKHGLDQLTMFKKSQSEGLLRYNTLKNVCSQFF